MASAATPAVGAVGRDRRGDGLRDAIAGWLPWTDGSGRRLGGWRGLWRLPLAAPFTLLYLVVAWALFVPLAHDAGGKYEVAPEILDPFAYNIPDLTERPLRVAGTLVTAPYFNHDSIQLVYVSLLLALFGIVFEVREGTRRTLTLFYAGLLSGALGAGIVLHLVYPALTEGSLYATSWERTWSGASAGAFGLMGALAARARRPGLLLLLIVAWDLHWPYLRVAVSGVSEPAFDLVWWHVPHAFSSVFHLPALAVGFVLGRRSELNRSPAGTIGAAVLRKVRPPWDAVAPRSRGTLGQHRPGTRELGARGSAASPHPRGGVPAPGRGDGGGEGDAALGGGAKATGAARRAKPAWTIEPATADGLLAALGVEDAPFAGQYAAVQRFARTPEARGMPGGVRSELRRRGLLASTGSGRIEEVESLAGVRAHIDRIDQELVAKLAERGAYVRQAARFKRTEAEARAPERVEQVIGRVRELAEQWSLEPEVAERVYRTMIAVFVEQEIAELAGRRRG